MTDTQIYDSLRESIDRSRKSRKEAAAHFKYYHGDQLPPAVLAELANRRQPVQWENTYKKLASKIQGIKINSRQEIKVTGRQVAEDLDVGHILTDILRTLPDSTDYYTQHDEADLDLMLAGRAFMAPELVVHPQKDRFGKNEKSLRVVHIPSEEMFVDPHARKKDLSDARYMHRVAWVDKEELARWADKGKLARVSFATGGGYDVDVSYARTAADTAYGRERALIVYSWYRAYEGGEMRIRYRVWDYSTQTVLIDAPSPYRFNRFPIAARVLYRDRANPGSYAGLFGDIKPVQDRINFMHLRITNLMGSHKLLIEHDAVDDFDEFISSYSKDDSATLVNKGAITGAKIKDITNHASVERLMGLIQDSRRQAEEVIGLNQEALGMAVNRLSGDAIERRQAAGLLGLRAYLEASDQLDKDLYGLCIEMIQQFYDAEQVFRIVEPGKAERYFKINEPEVGEQGLMREGEQPRRKNRIDIGRYDVVLTTVPEGRGSIAERNRQGVEIMKMLQATDPELAAAYLPHHLMEIESPAADAVRDLIAQRMEALQQKAQSPEAQAAQQMEMQRVQLELKALMAKVQEMESKAMMNAARTQEAIERAKYTGEYAAAQGGGREA